MCARAMQCTAGLRLQCAMHRIQQMSGHNMKFIVAMICHPLGHATYTVGIYWAHAAHSLCKGTAGLRLLCTLQCAEACRAYEAKQSMHCV